MRHRAAPRFVRGGISQYFADVSDGLIDIQGEVVGPYRMPRTIAAYAGDDNGLQGTRPNARTLADDAVTAANADVDFTPYDNDGNGYVDALIVVHAGRGGERPARRATSGPTSGCCRPSGWWTAPKSSPT